VIRNYSARGASRQAAIAAIGARQVHIVCNNAGISVGNVGLLDVTLTQWEWIFGVNVFGVVHGVQILVPHIRQHGEGGHIVNTASMAGLQVNSAIPGIGAYAMTEHAVVALSEGLAMELRGSDIGVSVLCPAQVATTICDSGLRRPERLGGSYTSAEPAEAQARAATGRPPDAAGERVLAREPPRRILRVHAPGVLQHPSRLRAARSRAPRSDWRRRVLGAVHGSPQSRPSKQAARDGVCRAGPAPSCARWRRHRWRRAEDRCVRHVSQFHRTSSAAEVFFAVCAAAVEPRGDRPPPSITPIDVRIVPHIQEQRVGP
jgi:NAD(P)-dependent dehydrogenase (short-subunit alcohol dehydrogenase family)